MLLLIGGNRPKTLKVDIKRNFELIGGAASAASAKNNNNGTRTQSTAAVTVSASVTNANKSLPTTSTNPGSPVMTVKTKKAVAMQPPKDQSAAGAPLPPLRQKAMIIKDKVPPPVPPRGSPRSTGGGSTSSMSNRQHNHSHSSVRSSKDSLRDAGWTRRSFCSEEIFV